MASYISSVKADIARWQAAALITPETATLLAAEVERHRKSSFSFGAILAMLAALLIGAAVLLFVSANWEAMPRLFRVTLLFTIVIASYLAGAVAENRDAKGWGEALYVLGAIAFGGSIALVGQMYHLSGDEADALAAWASGPRSQLPFCARAR